MSDKRKDNMNQKDVYAKKHLLPQQYADNLLIFEGGDGVYVSDSRGKRYLDFAAGVAVNNLGYGNRKLAAILAKQAESLIHTSNLFTSRPTLELASRLVNSSPLPSDQPWAQEKSSGYFAAVHFGNSGTEANEAAIKYARIYHYRRQKVKHKILAFENSFHGRTMGALSLTFTEKYRKPFAPLLPGVSFGKLNDLSDLERRLNDELGAIIVEPIQGEGGLHSVTEKFANALNDICRQRDIILIADEVQSGLGRCGTLYASEAIGLEPDIITLSKPLAAGLPLSATLIKQRINETIQIGDHASTFGGGALTCAAANFLWDEMHKPGVMAGIRDSASYLDERLCAIRDSFPELFVSENVRGRGHLKGLVMHKQHQLQSIIANSIKSGLLLLRSGHNVLRFAPPLIIDHGHVDEMEVILRKVLGGVE